MMDIKVNLGGDNSQNDNSGGTGFKLPKDNAFSEFSMPIRWGIKIGIVLLALLSVVLGVVAMLDTVLRCIFGGVFLMWIKLDLFFLTYKMTCPYSLVLSFLDSLKSKYFVKGTI